jgi:hypothetical protein
VVRRGASLSADGDGDPASGATVFSSRIQLTGGPNGQVTVQRSGPLRYRLDSGAVDLLDQQSASGDPSSRRLVEKTLDEFGTVHILLVPDQVMSYSYASIVAAPFELEATLETRVSNVAGGTGAASAFGVPLSDLDDALNVSVDSLSASMAVQSAVNEAREAAARRTVPVGRGIGGCGAFGADMLGMAIWVGVSGVGVGFASARRASRRVDPPGGPRYSPRSIRGGESARRVKQVQ